jgi:hypothetical protein
LLAAIGNEKPKEEALGLIAEVLGLKDADGLNLNSLASTLSLETDDVDVCLLWSDPGRPRLNFESFHETLV